MNVCQKDRLKKSQNLRDLLTYGKTLSFIERTRYFSSFLKEINKKRQSLYLRKVHSSADREIKIIDMFSGKVKKMLMFGSNNYLGLANHPYVKEKVSKAMLDFGVGIGGPPLLNGYTSLHHQLEERLSSFKHKEDTIIFSTGYGTNVGLLSAAVSSDDLVIYDEYSHASFSDGIRMAHINSVKFEHNNVDQLDQCLSQELSKNSGDRFIGVEGVYSMDGDLAPLNKIVPLAKKYQALTILDDAHGTGVLGKNGSGTAEHFGLEKDVDITMGTFSKTFAVVGGFISAAKPIVDFLRFFARSYMFSASLPPIVIAAVLAGMDVIKNEPERIKKLHENVNYLANGLKSIGFNVKPQAAIIALPVPKNMDIRNAAYQFHEHGIFINAIEYPAVPLQQQRFRISLMTSHTHEDMDRLLACIKKIWSKTHDNSLIN